MNAFSLKVNVLFLGCAGFFVGCEVSLAFRALMLFLCCIFCLMCSGSSLHAECILPFGMFRLSALRKIFVKMVFSV